MAATAAMIWTGHGQETSIQVHVDMVSLLVAVEDGEGHRVCNLQKEDFSVYEDRAPQEIAGFTPAEEPVSVVLALDTSASMKEKIELIREEAIRFVTMLKPEDSLAIVSFANYVNLAQDFSFDRQTAAVEINAIQAKGGTSLYDAISMSLDGMLGPDRERKALVIFSDGVDTVSRESTVRDTLRPAKEKGAAIYSIFFNTEMDSDRIQRSVPLQHPQTGDYPDGGSPVYLDGRRFLSKLAEASGGAFFDALSADDLGSAFEKIALELRSLYSLDYYPTNTNRDGKFRKIRVKVDHPGYKVKTRRGYFAPKMAP